MKPDHKKGIIRRLYSEVAGLWPFGAYRSTKGGGCSWTEGCYGQILSNDLGDGTRFPTNFDSPQE